MSLMKDSMMKDSLLKDNYRIFGEIGSGGGGVVYLAYHERLKKQVILKADKRRVTANESALRREVDILKTLNNKYIPQVYDYFIENDTVYTVMEYIEGESLNHPLKRGERYEQKTILTWILQLLDALDYLHSPTHGDPPKGYVHCDIKPSNLMLRPDGSICLIDFNIARAVGDLNAVGHTAGYSSTEHYGIDYSSGSLSSGGEEEQTELVGNGTESRASVPSASRSTSSGSRKVVPDVRSDIYSTGATMYRLFSGTKPASDAKKVIPLTKEDCNENIARIINKAMRPNPDERYQSAAQMRQAILDLKKEDPRAKALKAKKPLSLAFCFALLFLGLSGIYIGLNRMRTAAEWLKTAEYAQAAYEEGNREKAISVLEEVTNVRKTVFTPEIPARFQEVLTTVREIYDLSTSFKPHLTADLPSDPSRLVLSPEGSRIFALCGETGSILDTETGEELFSVDMAASAYAKAVFLDENRIAYAGKSGLTVSDLEAEQKLWEGETAVEIAASPNAQWMAAFDQAGETCLVYEADSGRVRQRIPVEGILKNRARDAFVDPGDTLFCLDDEGKYLAYSTQDGRICVHTLEDGELAATLLGEDAGYSWFSGGFFGKYLAFSAKNAEGFDFAIVDLEDRRQTGGFHSDSSVRVRTDESGIYVSQENYLVRMEPETGEQEGLVETRYTVRDYSHSGDYSVITDQTETVFFDRHAKEIASYAASASDNMLCLGGTTAVLGLLDQPKLRILKLDVQEGKQAFAYDPSFRHLEARISEDGSRLMLFSLDRFRIVDTEGEVIVDVPFEEPEQIYDRQYLREDGKSVLEVRYYDGRVLVYDAMDGRLVSDRQLAPYEGNMDEEYRTASWQIDSPAYANASLFDGKTGKFVRELTGDGNLAYATETSSYLVLQFINEDTGRWTGKILNESGEEIAQMPYLCDVWEGKLVFDYPSGDVRLSPIYSLEELLKD